MDVAKHSLGANSCANSATPRKILPLYGTGSRTWDAGAETWGWSRSPPASCRAGEREGAPKAQRRKVSSQEKALTEFQCRLCGKLAQQPVSTPCSHVFCKPCLDAKVGAHAGCGVVWCE